MEVLPPPVLVIPGSYPYRSPTPTSFAGIQPPATVQLDYGTRSMSRTIERPMPARRVHGVDAQEAQVNNPLPADLTPMTDRNKTGVHRDRTRGAPSLSLKVDSSVARLRHDSSPVRSTAAAIPQPSSSRTSSRAPKRSRPGTAATNASLSKQRLPRNVRRAASLNDGALPSYRARAISPAGILPPLPSTLVENDTSDRSAASGLHAVTAVDTRPSSSSGSQSDGSESLPVKNRRKVWHVLSEVVAIEGSYLGDLRVLVKVYLEQLSAFFPLAADELSDFRGNAEELLSLHEALNAPLSRVRSLLERLSVDSLSDEEDEDSTTTLARSVEQLARVYVSNANRFDLYQVYCAGQSEARDVVSKLQERSAEWDAFEERCTMLASGVVTSPSGVRRRHSTDGLSRQGSFDQDVARPVPTSRLRLLDYLIRPVQHVCRLPLLLGELRRPVAKASLPSSSLLQPGAYLDSALQTMNNVAAEVNAAKKLKEAEAVTQKIASKTELPQFIPSGFLMSIGNAILAGPLEVIYHHSVLSPFKLPAKARYYAAFLYPGYLVFAKARKPGIFEPRHFFPLKNAELSDVLEEKSFIPHSFRLSVMLHHFEISAKCSAEKDVWTTAIAEARKAVYDYERLTLISSLHLFRPQAGNGVGEMNDPNSSFRAEEDVQSAEPFPFVLNDREPVKDMRRSNSIASPRSLGRRTSIFSVDSGAGLVRRPTASQRQSVERYLDGIFSVACQQARASAVPIRQSLLMGDPGSNLPGSWSRATSSVISRTSSVGHIFHKRSVVEPKSASVSRNSSADPEATSQSATSTLKSIPMGGIAFPVVGVSSNKRRMLPTLTMNTHLVLEKDEHTGEDLATPDSAGYPLTPDASDLQDCASALPVTPSILVHTGTPTPDSSRKRSLSTRSRGFSFHSRTKSQQIPTPRNVKSVFFGRRSSMSSADHPPTSADLTPSNNSMELDGTPTAVSPVSGVTELPSTPVAVSRRGSHELARSPTITMFQKGLTLIKRKQSDSGVGGGQGPISTLTHSASSDWRTLFSPQEWRTKRRTQTTDLSMTSISVDPSPSTPKKPRSSPLTYQLSSSSSPPAAPKRRERVQSTPSSPSPAMLQRLVR